MRYLTRLGKDLEAAAAAGVLSVQDARRAVEWIAENQGAGFRGVTWIAIFAGLSIVSGVSLIIAHNWDRIPAAVRVAGFLVMLAATGGAALATRERERAVAVPLETLWFFMPILGIGLYAQVFQLSGDPVKPLLLWILLTAPLAWLSPHPVAAPIHVLTVLVTLYRGTLTQDSMLSFITARGRPLEFAAPLISAVLLALALAEGYRRLPRALHVWTVGAVMGWILCLMAADTPLHVGDEGLLAVAGCALATLWLFASLWLGASEGERWAPRAGWLFVQYLITFFWHDLSSYRFGRAAESQGALLVWLLAAAGLAAAAVAPRGVVSEDPDWERFGKGVLAVAMLNAALLLAGAGLHQIVAVVANLLLVAAGLGLMWHGSLRGGTAQINAGVATLLLILITRFIDIFGTMLQGGMAFIVTGLVLAALAYGLSRSRAAMIARSRGRA